MLLMFSQAKFTGPQPAADHPDVATGGEVVVYHCYPAKRSSGTMHFPRRLEHASDGISMTRGNLLGSRSGRGPATRRRAGRAPAWGEAVRVELFRPAEPVRGCRVPSGDRPRGQAGRKGGAHVVRGEPYRLVGKPQRQRPQPARAVHVVSSQETGVHPDQLGVMPTRPSRSLSIILEAEVLRLRRNPGQVVPPAQVTIIRAEMSCRCRRPGPVGRVTRRQHLHPPPAEPVGQGPQLAPGSLGPYDQLVGTTNASCARAARSCSHANSARALYASGALSLAMLSR